MITACVHINKLNVVLSQMSDPNFLGSDELNAKMVGHCLNADHSFYNTDIVMLQLIVTILLSTTLQFSQYNDK